MTEEGLGFSNGSKAHRLEISWSIEVRLNTNKLSQTSSDKLVEESPRAGAIEIRHSYAVQREIQDATQLAEHACSCAARIGSILPSEIVQSSTRFNMRDATHLDKCVTQGYLLGIATL